MQLYSSYRYWYTLGPIERAHPLDTFTHAQFDPFADGDDDDTCIVLHGPQPSSESEPPSGIPDGTVVVAA